MANVSFIMGTDEKINQVPEKQGQILVSTDTKNLSVDITDSERITIGGGLGETTSDGGEIFNLYEETEASLGTIAGAEIGKQKLPKNTAGEYAHAEGVSTAAIGKGSHTEGVGTKTSAEAAHAEGAGTLVLGAGSHAEGRGVNFSVNVTAIDGNVVTVKSNNSSIALRASELEAIKKNAVIFYETNNTNHDGVFYYATATETETFLGVATENTSSIIQGIFQAVESEAEEDLYVVSGTSSVNKINVEGKSYVSALDPSDVYGATVSYDGTRQNGVVTIRIAIPDSEKCDILDSSYVKVFNSENLLGATETTLNLLLSGIADGAEDVHYKNAILTAEFDVVTNEVIRYSLSYETTVYIDSAQRGLFTLKNVNYQTKNIVEYIDFTCD